MTTDFSKRSADFKRNAALESLLKELNNALVPAEQIMLPEVNTSLPIIFIVGPLRSGSTLMMQWLANTGHIAYPTNFMSRFFQAPIIGAKIQQLLTEPQFQFRDELSDLAATVSMESHNGKTAGSLSPNEFWYFWRRFLPFDSLDFLPTEQLLQQVNIKLLVTELTGIAQAFAKPLALKAMILNHNIDFLAQIFSNALFIQTKRDPAANMASILDARQRQFGNIEQWYSFKGPEYEQLASLEPELQVAGQVFHLNRVVDKAMADLPEHKTMTVYYEDFCQNPARYYQLLRQKLQYFQINLPEQYHGPKALTVSRDKADLTQLNELYQRYLNRVSQIGG